MTPLNSMIKYIDHEVRNGDSIDGNYYTYLLDGTSRQSTPEELSQVFGEQLCRRIYTKRNEVNLPWDLRQSQKGTGMAYWSITITPENLKDVIIFLGEEKVIQFIQTRLNNLGQFLTTNKEIRSADGLKCDEEEVVARLTNLSSADPDSLKEVQKRIKSLVLKLSEPGIDTTTREELSKKLLENINIQASKLKG
jgi:hypothetical protein